MYLRKIAVPAIAMLFICLFASASFSQNYSRENHLYWPGNLAGRSADMLYYNLSLTPDQYNQVYSSFLNYYNGQQPDILGRGPYTNFGDQRTKISGYLNPDQVNIFTTYDDNAIYKPVLRNLNRRSTSNSSTRNSNMETNKTGNTDVNKTNTSETK